jgi:sugar lactone lactonase YvrE
VFAETRGRPLGMELAADGTLYVADSVRGLLAVSADAEVRVLATEAGGVRIGLADDVDIGPDGTVYFSDASTKFRPQDHGGELAASLLDLMEHGGNGRLLAHAPSTGETRVLLRGLVFANGVAVAHDGRSVLVNETGNYRTLRYWLAGEKAGRAEPFLENLPGFPDNIGRGLEGRYWVALVSPRNKEFDDLAPWPALRAMVMRIPGALQPRPAPRANVFAVEDTGKIVASLQSTRAPFAYTGVTETADHLFLGSIDTTTLQRLPRPAL